MPRAKSAVLSAADTKAKIAELKSQLKVVAGTHKAAVKAVADAQKAHDKNLKGLNKAVDVAMKSVVAVQTQLDKLAPAPTA